MNSNSQFPKEQKTREIASPAYAPLKTGQELQSLMGGEGEHEAAQCEFLKMQAAILNALPAHIALLDSEGVIISVNEAWRRFARTNVFHGVSFAVGQNYLKICDEAEGKCAPASSQVAAGIRAVLSG